MLKLLAIAALAGFAGAAGALEKISLLALFQDKAIILIDGARHVMNSGETSPEGVKLLATDTQAETADIEIGGRRSVLKLGVVIGSFAPKGKSSAILYPNPSGHFFADGLINGTAVHFLVDTGATVIAMNSDTARRIGIDYLHNYVRTYNVTLNTVQVGDITLYNVPASVIEGNGPRETLLGMSFIGQLDMKRDSDKMELRER
jgi:aspartyl protease family protein